MTARPPRRVTVGRIVHYWRREGAELLEHAALVLDVDPDGTTCVLQVFPRGAAYFPEPLRKPQAAEPTEAHWTWPARV